MRIVSNPKNLQKTMLNFRQQRKSIGFVPTMGALHEGHLSLVRKARRENDIVIVSIFVNPTQFGPKEDLKNYPRPFQRDVALLKREKVDFVFNPSANQMYPNGFDTVVDVGAIPAIGSPAGQWRHELPLRNKLEGKFRPGHFRGAATVVLKLFHLAQPTNVYFGAKDYQQSVIMERMINDLDLPIRFHRCETIREKDGLAMSSRNQFLSPQDRKRASAISETLFWLRNEIPTTLSELKAIKVRARRRLASCVDKIDYLDIVDPHTLESLTRKQPKMVAATACFVGKTRLIDNVIIRISNH